jgi:CHAT domain-containing protein
MQLNRPFEVIVQAIDSLARAYRCLKLDADWVILSACDTAAGNAQSAEALSGLARAFIHAHARIACLALGGRFQRHGQANRLGGARDRSRQAVGRAEALRRAMFSMIDKGEAHNAHSTF